MNRSRLGTALLFCALSAGPVSGQQSGLLSHPVPENLRHPVQRPDRTAAVMRILDDWAPPVNFNNTPFEEVIDWLRQRGLENILVRWHRIDVLAYVDPTTPVTLRLSGLTVGEILEYVLEQLSDHADVPDGELSYRVVKGVLEISNRADFKRELVVRTYNVEDLLQGLIFFDDAPVVSVDQGERSSQGSGAGQKSGAGGGSIFESGGEGAEQTDYETRRRDRLESLIDTLTHVRRETWEAGNGPGSIVAFGNKLIITQTIEMHEIIGGALRESALRKQTR